MHASRGAEGCRPRRVYGLTPKGERALRDLAARDERVYELRDEGLLRLFSGSCWLVKSCCLWSADVRRRSKLRARTSERSRHPSARSRGRAQRCSVTGSSSWTGTQRGEGSSSSGWVRRLIRRCSPAVPTLRFVIVDVFTDRAFAGNQLAVFTDGREVDSETMQTLAFEIGFSETTFVLPAEASGTARIRIFTLRASCRSRAIRS